MQGSLRSGMPSGTKLLALLLVACLVESATEQRVNRGSKSTNLVMKVNGYRSQRGGSCNQYGHSCWGAHGKRSVTMPNLQLLRMIQAIASDRDRASLRPNANDISAFFNAAADDETNRQLVEPVEPLEQLLPVHRVPDARPMLDEDALARMQLWKALRHSTNDEE